MSETVPVKVIMTWDIVAEHEQEYFEFVIGEWVPGVQRLGLEPTDAWATVYGSYPQFKWIWSPIMNWPRVRY